MSKSRTLADVMTPAIDLRQLAEILGGQQGSDSGNAAELGEAVAMFARDPGQAMNALRKLQADDPAGFALAALRLLGCVEEAESSPGAQYLTGLIAEGTLLIDLLLDRWALADEPALALAASLAASEPLLDVRLVSRMFAHCGGNVRALPAAAALRALRLVEAISGGSRLSSHFVQLMRHRSFEVRSKVALLWGRSNLNLSRVRSFLASDDDRLRANAVESLWGRSEREARILFRDAAKDSSSRVAINALLGLCKAGAGAAPTRLIELASAENPTVRSGAAWAMGETGDPEFSAVLETLKQDPDPKVAEMAGRSAKKLQTPAA